jgi:hypothetical protein
VKLRARARIDIDQERSFSAEDDTAENAGSAKYSCAGTACFSASIGEQ